MLFRSEEHVFDKLLLYASGEGKKDFSDLCKSLKNASIKCKQDLQSERSNGKKGRGKKHKGKKEVVDLRTLLINWGSLHSPSLKFYPFPTIVLNNQLGTPKFSSINLVTVNPLSSDSEKITSKC